MFSKNQITAQLKNRRENLRLEKRINRIQAKHIHRRYDLRSEAAELKQFLRDIRLTTGYSESGRPATPKHVQKSRQGSSSVFVTESYNFRNSEKHQLMGLPPAHVHTKKERSTKPDILLVRSHTLADTKKGRTSSDPLPCLPDMPTRGRTMTSPVPNASLSTPDGSSHDGLHQEFVPSEGSVGSDDGAETSIPKVEPLNLDSVCDIEVTVSVRNYGAFPPPPKGLTLPSLFPKTVRISSATHQKMIPLNNSSPRHVHAEVRRQATKLSLYTDRDISKLAKSEYGLSKKNKREKDLSNPVGLRGHKEKIDFGIIRFNSEMVRQDLGHMVEEANKKEPTPEEKEKQRLMESRLHTFLARESERKSFRPRAV